MKSNLRFRALLLATVAVSLPAHAVAQEAAPPAAIPTSQEIIVTGTLITRPGFTSPTPITSVSSADIAKTAPNNIADVLNKLPQFGTPSTPAGGWQGGASAGINSVNLRNLGGNRTLVLLDGHRLVPSNTSNIVDLNTLPLALLKRVDVVTGGASAAYGSDALAGVVNFVLDRTFTGLKASVQYGNTDKSDYATYKGEIAAGKAFADGRGHFVVGLSYQDTPDLVVASQRSWFRPSAIIPNPNYAAGNGQPKLVHIDNAGIILATPGGLVVSGPLKNTQFIGPAGTPVSYNPGTVTGFVSYGGDADTSTKATSNLAQPYSAFNAYSSLSYDVSDKATAYVSFNYARGTGDNSAIGYPRLGNLVIAGDNAFIPAQTRAAMTAAGVSSLTIGTFNGGLNTIPGQPYGISYTNKRDIYRLNAGIEGHVGTWNWAAFYGHSWGDISTRWLNDPYVPNYNLAVDAVVAPAGNAAGIAPGTIVCRSTLTTPGNGCVPLNVFGVGPVPDAARNYIAPVAFARTKTRLDEAQVSLRGEPFSIWAGPVSVAVGASYRRDYALQTADPLSYSGLYYAGNTQPFAGTVNVWEGFGETVVPLVSEQVWAKKMELNAALRVTHYSTSGAVTTWKVGLSDQINDDIRLRATWSRDIRAPNLLELFNKGTSGGQSIFDPVKGAVVNFRAVSSGNADLKPEIADTYSAGIIFTPGWIRGLRASIDYYAINIKEAIAPSGTSQQILTNCVNGQTVFCPLVIRDAGGNITQIIAQPINTARAKTSGVDMEVQYRHALGAGQMSLRALGSYTFHNTSINNGISTDIAGSLYRADNGLPKLNALIGLTYEQGIFSGTVETRILGAAKYSNAYGAGDIDDNHIPAIAYLNLGGTLRVGPARRFQLFGAVDNLLDKSPPSIPALYNDFVGTVFVSTRPEIYDVLGRTFRIGLRTQL